ncbi:MAG: choice-of-anchor D domain-containing protein [Candidatus Sulfotelmatobacter sp.]
MLLPQSHSGRRSVRIAVVTALLALTVALPLNAGTAAPQLVCSRKVLGFGAVVLGDKETQLVVLTNEKSTPVTVSAISVSSSEFSISGPKLPMTLGARASVALRITFAPTAVGWVHQQVTFTSNASDPSLVLKVLGMGVKTEPITATPVSLYFGQVAVGTKAKLAVVLRNNCQCQRALSRFQAMGSEFSISDPPPAITLNPGQKVQLEIVFAPQSVGLSGGNLFIFGPSLNVPLFGTGTMIGQLSMTPAALNFGKVLAGETDIQTASLSATGGSVTISSAASSASQFVLAGASLPFTIDAGQTVDVKVAFAPQKSGSVSGTLSFSSNAKNGVVKESLTGTGTAPQVSLTWSPSTSQVSGYNVYRRLAGGSTYQKMNSSLDPDTQFTDATVAPGKTYEYVTTAVNSRGEESAYSRPAEVEIP